MEDLPMTNRLLTGLVAATIAASLAVASPVLARGGGGFGGGGHGGFGGGGHGGFGGGAHFGGGGMSMGGMGGAHFGGAHFGGARFAGGPMAAHAAFAPRFAGAGLHGRPFVGRHAFFFRHHRRFAFFGTPFLYANYDYYDGCWRRSWTPRGWQWSNVCGDYPY
jgi:hypothetical protein